MSGLFNDDTLSLYLKLKEAMKQYVRDAMPGGVLNREIKPQDTLDAAALSLTPVPVVGDVAGLLADGYRYATDPSSRTPLNYGLSALGALPFVPAMGAVTAWHGSPHKFDKFDLSKIGTGEGAQAYGHGLYLAESPEVARSYLKSNGPGDDLTVTIGGKDVVWGSELTQQQLDAIKFLDVGKRQAGQFPHNTAYYAKKMTDDPALHKLIDEWKDAKIGYKSHSTLYKTDIPDEAVARFLDWDKPLSEQAAEVRDALAAIKAKQAESLEVERFYNPARALAYKLAKKPLPDEMSGESVYRFLGKNHQDATDLLRKQGIPGIRYLDGGSRGAGTGTSNFVVFDPEMIRILERNGQPTGLQPWQPGEWEGLFKK